MFDAKSQGQRFSQKKQRSQPARSIHKEIRQKMADFFAALHGEMIDVIVFPGCSQNLCRKREAGRDPGHCLMTSTTRPPQVTL